MAKVIALKLNDKEERIIKRLNQEGISNSELIRDALWHYFRTVNQPVNYEVNQVNQKVNHFKEKEVNLEVNQNDFFSEDMEEKKVNLHSNERNNEFFYDYIFRLKNELNQVREESNKLQNDFQQEIKNMRKIFDESLPVFNLNKKEPILRKENDFSDVHNAIDEFLRKNEI